MKCKMLRTKNHGCFVLFILLLLHNENFASVENGPENDLTIPSRVTIPISYEIKLIPQAFEGNCSFNGESRIHLRVFEETTNITLRSNETVTFDKDFTNLIDADGVNRKPKNHSGNYATPHDYFLVIEFDPPIAPENYTLNLKYNVSHCMEGIYNCTYMIENGKERWLTASDFYPRNAHKVFPCLNDCDVEASFNLSIKHDTNVTAISNMPIRNKFLDTDGKIWTNFDTTPVVPANRLNFVVSDFQCLRTENKKWGFCGRKEFLPYLRNPLDVTERAMGFLEKYLDAEYIWPKLDQFTMPSNQKSDIGTTPWKSIKYVEPEFKQDNMLIAIEEGAVRVAQKIIAEWIGGLSHLDTIKSSWIIEGLSNYLGYYIVDKLFPDWREMDVFVMTNMQNRGFCTDKQNYSTPLERFPDDSNAGSVQCPPFQPFIRGGNLFYMLSNILTENTFKEGIRKFVKQSQPHTNSDDLWKAFQLAYDENNKESNGNLSISDIMKTWVQQVGYPIVNVTRDYETGKVTITQEGVVNNRKYDRYWIPINFATKSNPNFDKTTVTHWLKPDNESLVIDGIDKDDWIIVNIQQTGYYRVDYDDTNWKRLADYLSTENYIKIHPRNRAQLIDDLVSLVLLKRHNYTIFLDLVKYLSREDDYLSWYSTIRSIDSVTMITRGWNIDKSFKTFYLGMMEKILQNIDFKDELKYNGLIKSKSNSDHIDVSVKVSVPTIKEYQETIYKNETFFSRRFANSLKYTACSLGHPLCSESQSNQARAYYSHFGNNEIPTTSGMLYLIRCDEVMNGTEEELLKTMENATDTRYVDSLICLSDKTVLKKFIDKALNGELKPSAAQLYKALNFFILSVKNTPNNSIDYILQNADAIQKYFQNDTNNEECKKDIASLLYTCIQMTYTMEQLNKVTELVKKDTIQANLKEAQKVIEYQSRVIRWRENNHEMIAKWFRVNSIPVADV